MPGSTTSQLSGQAPAAPTLEDLEHRISIRLMQKVETELVDKIAGRMASLMTAKADAQRGTASTDASAGAAAAASAAPAANPARDAADDDDAASTRKDRQATYSSWGDSSWGWASETKEWSGRWDDWSSSKDWDDRSRPYLSHLTIPEFNGSPDGYHRYKYLVQNLKSQISPKDLKYLAPSLISKFKGPLLDDFQRQELDSSVYAVDTGVDDLLAYLRKRINIKDPQGS